MAIIYEVYYGRELIDGHPQYYFLIKGFEDGQFTGEVKSDSIEYIKAMLEDVKRRTPNCNIVYPQKQDGTEKSTLEILINAVEMGDRQFNRKLRKELRAQAIEASKQFLSQS